MKKIVILSGAGISAESGIKTFRDSGGLWENHDVMEVASIDGWNANPELVLEFYNARRAQLTNVVPNKAHDLCAELEGFYQVDIVTQNVDDLHERAGSSRVLHLHGSLLKSKSEKNSNLTYDCVGDIKMNDLAEDGSQLRPAIVWFGEDVPLLGEAMVLVRQCDILIIIGTSMQVYPAASLSGFAHNAKIIYLIDPQPADSFETRALGEKLRIVKATASIGMEIVYNELINLMDPNFAKS
jgi:NAD-dependent deacetylase